MDDASRCRGNGLQRGADGPHRLRTPRAVGGLAARLATTVSSRRLQHADQRTAHRPVVARRSRALRQVELRTESRKETGKMTTPPIVSAQAWDAALADMLVKEKEFTRARDALAAERRKMPWTPVEKEYVFDGPDGKASLLDLFDGRRQLIVYRAFFQPDVHGWPEHACVGCSLMADPVPDLTHLHARDTTFVYASPARQCDIH